MKINLPLAMGLGILGNHRPTRAPQGFFGGLGGGMAQGLQMYAQYQQQAQQAEMQKQRMEAYKRQVAAQEAKGQKEARMAAEREQMLQNLDPKVAQMIRLGLPQWQAEAAGMVPEKEQTQFMFNTGTGAWERVPESEITAAHRKARPTPRAGRAPKKLWVMRDGKPVYTTESNILPTDAPYEKGSKGGDGDGRYGRSNRVFYRHLVDAAEELAEKGSLSPRTKMKVRNAQHYFQQPTTRLDSNGNLVSVTPGLPPGYDSVFEALDKKPQAAPASDEEALAMPSQVVPEQTPAQAPAQPSSQLTVETISERKPRNKGLTEQQLGEVVGVIGEINQLLEGETPTGIPGAISKEYGGFIRQMPGSGMVPGMFKDPRSSTMAKKFGRLQAIMTPELLKESRFTEQERAMIRRIVGDVNAGTDEVEIRNSMAELLDIIASSLERAGETRN